MRGHTVLVGLLIFSSGCVGLPGPESFKRWQGAKPKEDVKSLLGPAESKKPVRPGQTRDALHELLGTPDMMSADRSIESYSFGRHYGFFFCIIPLGHFWGDQTRYDDFDLVLHFDSTDRLGRWEFGEKLVEMLGSRPDHKYHYQTSDTEMYFIGLKGWPTTEPL